MAEMIAYDVVGGADEGPELYAIARIILRLGHLCSMQVLWRPSTLVPIARIG
jgi:hypothetical protein